MIGITVLTMMVIFIRSDIIKITGNGTYRFNNGKACFITVIFVLLHITLALIFSCSRYKSSVAELIALGCIV
jgi:hypothetical protein